jgi:hypothetical protein
VPARSRAGGKPGQYTQLELLLRVEWGFGQGGVFPRVAEDTRTRQVIERVRRDTTYWCGPTEWQARTAMRISILWEATPGPECRTKRGRDCAGGVV